MCMITKEIALFVFDEDLLQGIRDGGEGCVIERGHMIRNTVNLHYQITKYDMSWIIIKFINKSNE